MCGLCSGDAKERKAERENTMRQANILRDFARHLENLATGSVKPHQESKRATAVAIVRFIAEDWLQMIKPGKYRATRTFTKSKFNPVLVLRNDIIDVLRWCENENAYKVFVEGSGYFWFNKSLEHDIREFFETVN